ncbi:MAG: serine/threonine protein kinase, partial [Gammaproteobacteria bacterium]|nr:serine/threonine protein kinase [Gammaproteobacteria bacterium]
MIQRALIIDGSREGQVYLRLCLQFRWPGIEVRNHIPDAPFAETTLDWSSYELILVNDRLGRVKEHGLDWVRQIATSTDTPLLIAMSLARTSEISSQAIRSGADAFVSKMDACPQRIGTLVHHAQRAREVTRSADLTRIGIVPGVHTAQTRAKARSRGADKLVTPFEQGPGGLTRDARMSAPVSATADAAGAGQLGHGCGDNDSLRIDFAEDTGLDWTSQPGSGRNPPQLDDTGDLVRVPGYRLQRRVGRGGMATVWLTRREDDGAPLVLKILRFDERSSVETLTNFMREYELIRRLRHPNIARIFDRGFTGSYAYIALEYLSEGDLNTRIADGISPAQVKTYLLQIASGLQAAHAQNIIHRDLKPSNILFRKVHELALIDFGIAKLLAQDADAQTSPFTMKGTPYYMSPEHIKGLKLDPRTDLYSLGIILFEMLTGE